MKSIYITGATGFIGRHLIDDLLKTDYQLKAAVRTKSKEIPASVHQDVLGDLLTSSGWSEKLKSVDTLIHLAGYVSAKNRDPIDHLNLHKLNVVFTEELARRAAHAGVKRFIFLSSAKVNGEVSSAPFTENNEPIPQDSYALSKLEAEKRLRKISNETTLDVVILRPSLVYGNRVKGNFQALLNLVDLGIPLPFGGIKNKRTFCSVYNLTDFIRLCITHEDVVNETFLVGDRESLSTSELFTLIANAKGKSLFLISLPNTFMKILLRLLGKKAIFQRLYCDFEVNTEKAQNTLGWKQHYSVKKSIQMTISHDLLSLK